MSEKSKGREAGLEAKGGLPFFKGGGHADLTTMDVETEKVVRYHDLYVFLEEGLLEYGYAKEVTPEFDFDNWSFDFFRDSDFLLIRPELLRFTN